MPEIQGADDLVGALLDSCCLQLVETMFFSPVLDHAESRDGVGRPRVATRLHFHGKPGGDLEIDVDPLAARLLAASFLGTEPEAVPETLIDQVMGEFANMACGSVLSSLGRVEYFHLETPTTWRPAAYTPGIDGVRRGLLLDGGTLSICLRVDFGPGA